MGTVYDQEQGASSTIGRSFGAKSGMRLVRMGDVAQDASAAFQELDQAAGDSMPVPAREDAPAPAAAPSDNGNGAADQPGPSVSFQEPAQAPPELVRPTAQVPVQRPRPVVVVDARGNDLAPPPWAPPDEDDDDADESTGLKVVVAAGAGFGLGWLVRSLLGESRTTNPRRRKKRS
jgi:hypothetical protein